MAKRASDGGSSEEGNSLGPRRAAEESPDAPQQGSWRVAAIVGAALVAMIVLFYFLFGEAPGEERDRAATSGPAPLTATETSPAPSPSPSYIGTQEIVGDASITLPENWTIYADEVTEGDRRLIRASADDTALRLQVATLTTVGTDVTAACLALVEDQSAQYDVDFQISPRYVSVSGEGAIGVTCGFVGTRTDQEESTSVLFTMVQREEDLHTLVLRTMHPTGTDASSLESRQLTSLTCEAATTFGHTLPLCPNYSP